MGHSVLCSILKEIQMAGWYSIMVDEATDISRNEQMCLCVRWVDEEYSVNEDTIGLVHVSKTDSTTLFTEFKAALVCCMLPLDKCRGQAYDGAVNMSGKHRGVAALVKKEENAVVHVHCLAHSLNLSLQDVTRTCLSISEGLLFIRELIQLIKWSPKRHSLFETLKLEDSPDSPHLRTLCPTRWTVRNGAIDAILSNYGALCKTLNEISENGRDEYALKANGLLHTMEKFSTYFGLKLGYLIFSVTEQLSCTLQGKDTTCQEAKEAALLSVNYLKKLRNDEEFKKFYTQVIRSSQGLTDEPSLPRKRKLPKRINDGAESYQFNTPEGMHRQQYFLALDESVNELLRRFEQRDLSIIIDVENLLLKNANESQVDTYILESMIRTYEKDLKFENLKLQLKLLPDLILRHREITGITIKKVTNI